MRILNLYSGIGGNRKLWNKLFSVSNQIQVTAIENDPLLAEIYKNFFPNDTVIVGDAHEYLRQHYQEFDFIWSSPPCQTHSSFRHNICVRYRGTEPKFPDMTLYEEILFLKHHFKGKWIVENVKPYYEPLIKPQILQRHCFWSNFEITDKKFVKDNIRKAQIPQLQKKYGLDLKDYKLKNKRQVLRNCVEPEIGLHILKEALPPQR
jgi:DNA (cytosine-5)-methyltransferase 1